MLIDMPLCLLLFIGKKQALYPWALLFLSSGLNLCAIACLLGSEGILTLEASLQTFLYSKIELKFERKELLGFNKVTDTHRN